MKKPSPIRHALLAVSFFAVLEGCASQQANVERLMDDAEVPSALASGESIRAEFELRDGFYLSPALLAPETATRVGLMIDLTAEGIGKPLHLEARGIDDKGVAGAWLPVEYTWREDVLLVGRADLDVTASAVEVRVPEAEVFALEAMKWEAIELEIDESVMQPPASEEDSGIAQQDFALSTALSSIGVKPKSAWGARASSGCSSNSTKTKMAVHHTVTPPTLNGSYEARLRQIQAYHMDSRGYCDIGYHFLVTRDGRLWEGRPLSYLGAHVGSYNTGNIGISFVGCFHPSGCSNMGGTTPPQAMIDAGGKLIKKLSSIYGIARNSTYVKGHRSYPDQGTSCPGDYLNAKLPTLRSY
jgi:hypothetical protein